MGACSCWACRSIPDALRMWLLSLAPFSGSRNVNRAKPSGMPASATSRPYRQLWAIVTT